MGRKIAALVCGMIVLGLAASAPLSAQDEEAPPAEPSWTTWEEAIDGFFVRLEAGEPEEAVSHLYAGYPFMDALGDQVMELENQLAELTEALDGYVGQQRIAVQPISDRFVYVWYLAFYQRQPLQFHFSFYKPQDRWVIHQFSYDQGMVEIARELTRRRMIGEIVDQ